MKKELLQIVASYLGNKCRYSDQHTNLTAQVLFMIDDEFVSKKFKLMLRKINSITESELMALAGFLKIESPFVFQDDYIIGLRDNFKYCPVITIEKDENCLKGLYTSPQALQIVNYLRAKGFCLDNELLDNNMIEWVGN